MNYKTIARLLGLLLIGVSVFMATAIVFAVHSDGIRSIVTFSVASAITAGAGLLLYMPSRKEKVSIHPREAIAVVTLGWIAISLFGGIPYMIDGTLTNPADAFFESASGFTTTGSSVMTDIESSSRSILYWRSLTQWLGGMGIIVLFIAILPQLGVGAKHLFKSEVPGPITETLKPKLKQTSSILWKIYIGFTATLLVSLMLAGMSFFDALCHSLTCMATGGFSTMNMSIAHYDSAAIDVILTFFMLFAGINFGLYYVLTRGRIKDFVSNVEFQVYIAVNVVAILLIALNIMGRHPNFFEALRYASFQTLSVSTATGFVTDNFDRYPSFSKILMVVLMFMGGSAGSTAGGIKVSRIVILVKAAYNEIYKAFHPHAVFAVKVGKQVIDETIIRSVLIFVGVFILSWVVGTLVMASMGLDMATAASSVVACMSNVGPGLARVGAIENFAFIPWGGKLFLSFMMILGRLELFTVLVLLIPDFWRR
ncbi:MAG: TrkH family potassium uptake protein [candidate division Zixibacteria bacterium]|nr:TrkH family potassium uptake protein [candidate division Zixibacteria bacterium]MBU1471132.1 TrkH family potassium uptake protein [candidate division Zixibacteria bacterium]MBU2626408.1 TrkH family potassium uptake protein [candidate division Zixibacteria bacterium]